jgi:hypothetical protein
MGSPHETEKIIRQGCENARNGGQFRTFSTISSNRQGALAKREAAGWGQLARMAAVSQPTVIALETTARGRLETLSSILSLLGAGGCPSAPARRPPPSRPRSSCGAARPPPSPASGRPSPRHGMCPHRGDETTRFGVLSGQYWTISIILSGVLRPDPAMTGVLPCRALQSLDKMARLARGFIFPRPLFQRSAGTRLSDAP